MHSRTRASTGQFGRTATVRRSSAGFSLMEVILATAILLGSVVVLSELAGIGRRQSIRGQALAEAQRLCEQTLIEVVTGWRPLEPREQEPLLPAETKDEQAVDSEPVLESMAGSELFGFDDRLKMREEPPEADGVEAARWLHSLRVTPLEEHPGLAVLTVVVEESPESSSRPVRFELSRWIDDPFAADAEPREGEGGDREMFDLAVRGGRAP